MGENLHNIDDLFRKALDAHEDTPSGDVWANIDKNLDKKKVVFISRKYKKLKWAAAALLIFSAGMAMYTWNTRLRNKELVKQNETNKKTISKAGASQKQYTADDGVRGVLTDKQIAKTIDKAAQNSTEGKAEKEHQEDISRKEKTDIVKSQQQNKSSIRNLEEAIVKITGGKKAKEVAVTNKEQDVTKEKPLSKPVDKSIETGVNDKQSNTTVSVEKKNTLIPNASDKTAPLKDEATFEKVKREIETGTAREQEKNVAIMDPINIERGKTLEIVNESNKETSANNGASSYRKSSVKPSRSSKFSATVFYSPDFVSSKIDNDKHAFREDDRNEIKGKERISNSSTIGVLVNYNIYGRWNIQTGLGFSTMTTDIQPKNIFARPDERGNINYRFNCSAGYSYVSVKSGAVPAAGDSIMALSSKNTLRYTVVPLGLTYSFPFRKFSLAPGAGLAANFLTSGKIEAVIKAPAGDEKSTLNKIEGLSSSYLNGSISLAANYYFTKNLALSFTPVARFALTGINKDAPVKTYLNSFGLAAGLTIGF